MEDCLDVPSFSNGIIDDPKMLDDRWTLELDCKEFVEKIDMG